MLRVNYLTRRLTSKIRIWVRVIFGSKNAFFRPSLLDCWTKRGVMADLVDLYATRDDTDEEDADYSSGEERPSPSKKRRRGQDGGHNSDGDEDGNEEDGDEEDSSEEEDDDNEEEARKVKGSHRTRADIRSLRDS